MHCLEDETVEDLLEQLREIEDPEERALTAREWGLVVELGRELACAGNGPNAQINLAFFDPDLDID